MIIIDFSQSVELDNTTILFRRVALERLKEYGAAIYAKYILPMVEDCNAALTGDVVARQRVIETLRSELAPFSGGVLC